MKKTLIFFCVVTLVVMPNIPLTHGNDSVTEAKGAIIRYCIEKHYSPVNHKANWLIRKYEDWKLNSKISKCMDAQAEALNNIDWNSPYLEMCVLSNITSKGNWNHVGIWECVEGKKAKATQQ